MSENPAAGAAAELHPNVRAVQAALDAADARAGDGRRSLVRVLPDAVRTAATAAAALGVTVGQIANSLVFTADDSPLLVLTSGAHRVDTGLIARVVGASRVERASAELVRAATGQPIGGVAPLGHPQPIRTLLDVALEQYPEIWAAGGVPRAVFPTRYDELLRITSASPAAVA